MKQKYLHKHYTKEFLKTALYINKKSETSADVQRFRIILISFHMIRMQLYFFDDKILVRLYNVSLPRQRTLDIPKIYLSNAL